MTNGVIGLREKHKSATRSVPFDLDSLSSRLSFFPADHSCWGGFHHCCTALCLIKSHCNIVSTWCSCLPSPISKQVHRRLSSFVFAVSPSLYLALVINHILDVSMILLFVHYPLFLLIFLAKDCLDSSPYIQLH